MNARWSVKRKNKQPPHFFSILLSLLWFVLLSSNRDSSPGDQRWFIFLNFSPNSLNQRHGASFWWFVWEWLRQMFIFIHVFCQWRVKCFGTMNSTLTSGCASWRGQGRLRRATTAAQWGSSHRSSFASNTDCLNGLLDPNRRPWKPSTPSWTMGGILTTFPNIDERVWGAQHEMLRTETPELL